MRETCPGFLYFTETNQSHNISRKSYLLFSWTSAQILIFTHMTLTRAIHIASEAHKEQKDKVGKPYITHVIRVMERCKTEEEKTVAVLHDVVEDQWRSGWTLDRLKQEGFNDSILAAVDAITQRERQSKNNSSKWIKESKTNYIKRVKKNALATRVKLNDLEDNMDIRRLPKITDKDVKRLKKDLRIYNQLLLEVSGSN